MSRRSPRHSSGFYHRVYWFDAHHRLFIALMVAAGTFLVLFREAAPITRLIATWDSFALTTLVLCWLAMWQTAQKDIRQKARRQDFGRHLVFVFTIFGACASVGAVLFLMHSVKDDKAHLGLHATVSATAIISSWLLLHTMFALKYAHSFYGDSRERNEKDHAGGLDFPNDATPDYLDFAYFSFVIGMTFQVSDVQITSKILRHLVLAHGIISFIFTVLIIALTINTVSNLVQ